jgi:DNA-binding transcriptional MerR regulator
MVGKARVQKRLYYKIGEACKALGIQPYVLRYWETEFPALAPSKSRSGQRVYSEKELEIIRRIKELLYDEGYTIAGAKKKLETELTSGSLGEATETIEVTEATEEAGTAAAVSAEPDEAPAEPPAPAAPPPPPPPVRRTARPSQPPAPAATDASAASPDTERVRKLRSGIARALDEARQILALLDAKSGGA